MAQSVRTVDVGAMDSVPSGTESIGSYGEVLRHSARCLNTSGVALTAWGLIIP